MPNVSFRLSLIKSIGYVFDILSMLIFIRVILSWVPTARNTSVGRFIYSITDPLIAPVRLMLQKSPLGGTNMMLDFSPLIVMLLLSGVKGLIVSLLR